MDLQEAIENIDIGRPTMLRAAAKNYQDVVVLVDPADYHQVLTELETNKQVSISTKFRLAAKVFEHTAHYDALIAEYLRKQCDGEIFLMFLHLPMRKPRISGMEKIPSKGRVLQGNNTCCRKPCESSAASWKGTFL